MSIKKAKQPVFPEARRSCVPRPSRRSHASMSVVIVVVEPMVGDPAVSQGVEIELVGLANLAKDRQQPPYASPYRFVDNARRAAVQRRREELVLDDVLLVFIEPADESVDLPKAPHYLLIAEETAAQDEELILTLDVVSEDAAA